MDASLRWHDEIELRLRLLGGDQLAGEGEALAAARPAAERRISAGGAGRAIARRRPDIALPKRIADANDHGRYILLMRMVRNS